MNRQPSSKSADKTISHAANIHLLQTLGDEEEAWYRPTEAFDSVITIRQWLRERSFVCSSSGNPLEDDEDAWARS